MNNIEKEKIGAFIGYHNIIRPIEYPLLGLVFISALLMLYFSLFTLFPPQEVVSSDFCGVGLGISVSMIIAGIFIRRRLLREHTNNPGKSLYYAQMILYVYCTIMGLLLILSFVNFLYGTNTMILAFITAVVLIGITLIAAYLFIRKMIIDGR